MGEELELPRIEPKEKRMRGRSNISTKALRVLAQNPLGTLNARIDRP